MNSKRKYFGRNKRNKVKQEKEAGGSGVGPSSASVHKPAKKPKSEGGERKSHKKKKKAATVDDLTGIYTACDSKTKKVCGKIVAPLSLAPLDAATSADTSDLVKSLVAKEADKLLSVHKSKKRKHKHREDKEHRHKHKKS